MYYTKTFSPLLILNLLLAQSAYGMHNYNGRLTVPQTNAEAQLHEQLIAEAKALAASKADAKSSMEAKTNAENLSPIFEETPEELQSSIVQYNSNPWPCCEAWLNKKSLELKDCGAIVQLIALSGNRAATINNIFNKNIIKISNLTDGKLICRLPDQDCQITGAPIQITDNIIAFGLWNGFIKLWDITTNQQVALVSCSYSSINMLCKLSDQHLVIKTATGYISILDITDINNPQVTETSEQLTKGSICKLSDTAFICFDEVPLDFMGLRTEDVLIVWDLFAKDNPTRLAPSRRKTIKLDFEPNSITRITDSLVACGNSRIKKDRGAVNKVVNIETGAVTDFFTKGKTFPVTDVLPLANYLISRNNYDLSIWDCSSHDNIFCIARLNANPRCAPFINITALSPYSFINTHHICESDIYEPDNAAFHEFNKLSFNEQTRLQALIHQLRRLNKEQRGSARPADPIVLTAWGEKWLAAMPEAIQKRLRANFNIKLLQK